MWRGKKIADWIDAAFSDIEDKFRPMWNKTEKCLEPLIDIDTTENEMTVTIDLPCVNNKNDISLSVTENSIEVKAIMYQTMQWDKWGSIQKDIDFTSFRKVINLPEKVDPMKARAKFSNSILTVKLPRVQKKFKIKVD